MITAKAKKKQWIYLFITLLSVFAILFLKVMPSWDHSQKVNMLGAWVMTVHGLPITGMMVSLVLFNIGRYIPALISSLVFTGFSIITTVNLIVHSGSVPWLMIGIDGLALLCSLVCLFMAMDRTEDYSPSFIIERNVACILTAFSGVIVLAYYCMNLLVQNFIYIPEIDAINFFGTLTVEKGESAVLHAIIASFIIIILFLCWSKRYKPFFCMDLALDLLLVIMIFRNLDMSYRTGNFYVLLFLILAEIVLAALIFKHDLKPDLSKKRAELELLRTNGKISEDEYRKAMENLNGGNIK